MITHKPWTRIGLLVTQVAFLIVAECVDATPNDTEKTVSLQEDVEITNQSVTFRGQFITYVASRAVDGDTDTCSRTARLPPRWWRLTLNRPVNVSRILVIGGSDRNGQELDMNKLNVTVALDDQSPLAECELSESVIVEDDHEWFEFTCDHAFQRVFPIKIINIADMRTAVTELSLCEVKVYESTILPNFVGEHADLTRELNSSGHGTLIQRWTSNTILISLCSLLLLLTSRWP